MNIEIAEHLTHLRKQHRLSQEELAEKLGVSRQAVSKWERAEASPDTDNLILLSKLYDLSLDELLFGDNQTNSEKRNETNVSIGLNGIHVEDGEDKVHVGWDGIYVDSAEGDHVRVSTDGVSVNNGVDGVVEGCEENPKKSFFSFIPWTAIITFLYLLCGIFDLLGGWGSAWVLFLYIPVCSTLVKAIEKRSILRFAYPVFTAALYCTLGVYAALWHPAWVIFFTIPLFYSIFKPKNRNRIKVKGHFEIDGEDDEETNGEDEHDEN